MRELLDKPLFEFEAKNIGKVLVCPIKSTDLCKILDKFPKINQSPPDKVVREVFIRTAHHPDDLTKNGFLQGKKFISESDSRRISKDDLEEWASKFLESKGNGLLDTEPITIKTKNKTKTIEPKSYKRKEGETSISFLHRIICDSAKSYKKKLKDLLKNAMGPAEEILEIQKRSITSLDRLQDLMNPYKNLMDSAYSDLDKIQRLINESHFEAPKDLPPIDEKATITWPNNQREDLNKRLDTQIQIQQTQTDILRNIIDRLSSRIPLWTFWVALLTLLSTLIFGGLSWKSSIDSTNEIHRLNENINEILYILKEDHQRIHSNKEKIDKIIKPPTLKKEVKKQPCN